MTRNHWDDIPGHPVEDWKAEVEAGDTRLSYTQWAAIRVEEAKEPEPETKSYKVTLAVTMRAYATERFEAVDDDAAIAHAKGLDFDDFHYTTEGEIDGDRVLMLCSDEDGDDFDAEFAVEPEGSVYSWQAVAFVEELAKRPFPTDNPGLTAVIAQARRLCERDEDEVETPIATDTAPDGDDAMRNRIDRELTEGRG
jgi:hypothetical protein